MKTTIASLPLPFSPMSNSNELKKEGGGETRSIFKKMVYSLLKKKENGLLKQTFKDNLKNPLPLLRKKKYTRETSDVLLSTVASILILLKCRDTVSNYIVS